MSEVSRRTLQNSHQTTIRFTKELWIALEHAAARRGVSVAQYVREAARARLGEDAADDMPELTRQSQADAARQSAFEHSFAQAESTAALWQQGRLARERAQMLRDDARRARARRIR
jgi:predicted DNA-binding protein